MIRPQSYGTVFAVPDKQPNLTPKKLPATSERAEKELYWHNQYQFMRERYYKFMGENSQQAQRIRDLEEHSTKQGILIDDIADSLRAMVAHCEGFISNLKEGK